MSAPRPPKVEVSCSLTVTETPEGKLSILVTVPEAAVGTIGSLVLQQAQEVVKHLLDEATGEKGTTTFRKLQ